MLKPVKFMGGSITFVEPAIDKKMADGSIRSWEKSVKIQVGKISIKVGSSFFEKMRQLLDDPEVERFVQDLE